MAKNKVVLITGSTEGIGKAAAFEMAKRGFRVLASGRNPEKLKALIDEAKNSGIELETILLDVTDGDSIRSAAATVDKLTGGNGLDILVNNAGYSETGPVDTMDMDRVRNQYETNVFGLLAVTQAFLPAMKKRGSGRIINVSSIAVYMIMPLFGVYGSTKCAVDSLSEAMRMELAGQGISVVCIEPGPIRTRFTPRAMETLKDSMDGQSSHERAMQRLAELQQRFDYPRTGPEAVARTIARVARLRKPALRYATPLGTAIGISFYRLIPDRIMNLVMRKVINLLGRI